MTVRRLFLASLAAIAGGFLSLRTRGSTQIQGTAEVNVPILVNVEIPDTRDVVLMQKIAIALSSIGRGACISDGWLDPLGAWAPLKRWVLIPECFPEELPAYADVAGCVSHAAAFGRAALPALGAYGTKWKGRLPVRTDYTWPSGSPHIVYPGDSVTDWKDWPA